MSVLDRILAGVRRELEERKAAVPLQELKARVQSCPPVRPFREAISLPFCGLIAELKGRSPSMGTIADRTKLLEAAVAYEHHPFVKAVSVLTNRTDFGGSPEFLTEVRGILSKPILRKDFIVDEYQIYDARAMGADAILLMASVVTSPSRFAELHDLALDLGLAVLCEVHDEQELQILPPSARICGINSRKFRSDQLFRWSRIGRWLGKDVTTKLDVFDLLDSIGPGVIRVVESGLNPTNVAEVVRAHSFHAALVGTSLLRFPEGPGAALDQFQTAFSTALPDAGAAQRPGLPQLHGSGTSWNAER